MRNKSHRAAQTAAVTGVMAALCLSALYCAELLPVGRAGITAVAGLILACSVVSAGLIPGICGYAVVSLLGFLILPVKDCLLLFVCFFGLYPLLKSLFERLRLLPLVWVLKFLFFNAVLTLFWTLLREILFPFLPAALHTAAPLYLVGNVAFIVYDVGFSKLMTFYSLRVDRVLRRMQ